MAKVIIYKNPDANNIIVTVPAVGVDAETVLVKDCPPGAIIVEDNEILPLEHFDFFDAWELNIDQSNNHSVSVNINTAKEITKARLRIERAPLLTNQDIAFQRALETNSNTATIVAEKNRLRDITKLADNAETLNDLRNLNCS